MTKLEVKMEALLQLREIEDAGFLQRKSVLLQI